MTAKRKHQSGQELGLDSDSEVKHRKKDFPENNNAIQNNKPQERLNDVKPSCLYKISVRDDIVDITMAMDRLKLSVVSKASALKSIVTDVTIGPNSSQDLSFQDISDEDKNGISNLITSTPQQEEHCRTSMNKSKIINNSLFDVSEVEKDENPHETFMRAKEMFRLQLLEDFEKKRKSEVYNKVLARLQVMNREEDKIREYLEKTKESIQQERLARATKDLALVQNMLDEEEQRAKLSLQKLSQSTLSHAKRLNDTNERIKELERQQQELEEKERQINRESRMCLDEIYEKQKEYRNIYQQIHDVSKTCRDSKEFLELVAPEVQKLKILDEHFDMILQNCERDIVSSTEVNTARNLVEQVANIYNYFLQSAAKINKRIEKAEDDAKVLAEKKTQQEKSKAEEKEAALQSNLSELADCISRESLAKNVKLNKFLEKYEKSLEPLINDDKTKKFRFDCQKAVNVPVNAISHLNSAHLEDKFIRLSQLLKGQNVPVGNSYVIATSHPLGVAFCTNLLAKKLVKQGEHTVSSKPEAAFAIAAVIVALWVEYPDFGQLLLAHFQRECPYLIPAYMPQVEGQSNEDYYRILGYQYSEDGKVEPQDKFLKRMTGIMRLYSAILITKLKRSQANKPHPLGINEGWRWLAAMLNLEPRPDISATLLFDMLDVTGNMFYQTYGSQFQKLLFLLCKDYFPRIEKITPDGCGGPVCRLKAFLERILVEGQLPAPEGLLPPNFW